MMHRAIKHTVQAAFIVLISSACSGTDVPTAPVAGDNAASALIPIPRPPIDKTGFVTIAGGWGFTCAGRQTGHIYCWGRNDHAQSGAPNAADVLTPRLITKPNGAALIAMQFDVGLSHACAIESSGLAWCWGDGSSGQVGQAAGVSADFMPDTVAGGFRFNSISAGGNTTCATSTAGFFCWGAGVGAGITVPWRITGYSTLGNVTVGDVHACAIDNADPYRVVNCFGVNSPDGQNGVSSSISLVPFMMTAQFGYPVQRVTTQGSFTCVDQSSGSVQCVGRNHLAQLGKGDQLPTYGVPSTIPNQQLRGVSVGNNHACALAPDNTARCWGDGSAGQLGQGINMLGGSTSPIPVMNNYTYRAIGAGREHTCAIGTDNLIYCWGYNKWGALGRGSASSYAYSEPKPTSPAY